MKERFDDMETLVLLDDNDLKTLVPKAGYRKRLEAALKKGQGQGHERGQACVMDNGISVVVCRRDLHLVESLEESDEGVAWSLTSVYLKLGLAVLEAMLAGACFLKAQPRGGRLFKRKLSHCASVLKDIVAMLRTRAVASDAGSCCF